MLESEPILQVNKDRFVIFPVKHHDIWDWYKSLEASFWTNDQSKLSDNIGDWNIGSENVKHQAYINSLAAFQYVISPSLLTISRYLQESIKYPEAKYFFGLQTAKENIHADLYAQLLHKLTEKTTTKTRLRSILETSPALEAKVQWLSDLLHADNFPELLIGYSLAQSLFKISLLDIFSLIKANDPATILSKTGDLITRDVKFHSEFYIHLHNNHLTQKIPATRLKELMLEASALERVHIKELNFNNASLQLLEYTTDQLLEKFGCEREFGVAHPHQELDESPESDNTSLMEKRVGKFRKAGFKNENNDPNKINQSPH